MKRFLAIMLCLILVLTLGGCGKKKKTPEDMLNDALNQAGDMLGNIDGLTSDISGLIPDVNGITSDISGLIPDVGGITSDISGLVPNVGGNSSHIHDYSSSTCVDPQICSCGEKRGIALGHNYLNGVCDRCGESDPNFIAVNSVIISGNSRHTIYVGQFLNATAIVSPANATNSKITWSSSNNAVATVNSSGKITAKSVGTATITAKTACGKYDSIDVTVEVDPLAGCKIITPLNTGELSYKNSYYVFHKSKINSIAYKMTENDGYIEIQLTLAGTKTYDIDGNTVSKTCQFAWKLYDLQNNVIATGSITTPSLSVGESYANLRVTIIDKYDCIPAGTYRLEFVDYAY